MAQLAWVPVEATPVSCVSRLAIAQRLSSLSREREANRKALRTAGARFKPPQTPAPTVTYRGLFRPLEVDVDPEWIRETIPHFSPRSRCGRRLRRHLRLYEEHIANMYADREASASGL